MKLSEKDMYFIKNAHKFSYEVEVIELFKDLEKFSSFCTKLDKCSKSWPQINPDRFKKHSNNIENEKKIKGDGFELFCQLFVNIFGAHKSVGLYDYCPTPPATRGVDAYAKNISGEKCAVQCKFLLDHSREITSESNINGFATAATNNGIYWPIGKNKKLFLFTSGAGLHYKTRSEGFNNRIKEFTYNDIREFVDDNPIFWKKCMDILSDTQEKFKEANK